MSVTDRLLIISLDGGTFDILHPAIADGIMPNLASLMNKGSTATLYSSVPPVTPVAWTTFMTGKNPGKHGIFDFRLFDRQTLQDKFANATHIQAHTLWKILSEMGLRVGVLNLPMTFPPQEVNGFIVSGFDTPSTESEFTYPPELREELLDNFPDYDFIPSWGRRAEESTKEFLAFTEAVRSAFLLRTEVAGYLVDKYWPDVFMVHYQNLDVLQHKAWGYLAADASTEVPQRKMALDCLRSLDDAIGALVSHSYFVGENILVISDHGFGPVNGHVHANDFLESWGYVVRDVPISLDDVPAIRRGGREILRDSSIGPLYKAVGRLKWRLRRRFSSTPTWLDKTRSTGIERILPLDWQNTSAVVGMAEIYGLVQILSDAGDRDELREQLTESFLQLTDPETGEPLMAAVTNAESVYSGPHADQVDLILVPQAGWTIFRRFAEGAPVYSEQSGAKGTHRPEGILIAAGPDMRSESPLKEACLTDLAPTIIHLLGGAVPYDFDGRVLTELLQNKSEIFYSTDSSSNSSGGQSMSPEEEDALEKRLRGLGYLG